jgi:hypothetical protein
MLLVSLDCGLADQLCEGNLRSVVTSDPGQGAVFILRLSS